MSHDQRPGKVRVVADAEPSRRRNDGAAPAPATARAGSADAAGAAPSSAAASGLPMLAILLFLLGCAAGGAAIGAMGLFR